MNKYVKISIQFSDGTKHKLKINKFFMRKISLEYNGKFEGFFSLTKIINRVRKIIVEYFK